MYRNPETAILAEAIESSGLAAIPRHGWVAIKDEPMAIRVQRGAPKTYDDGTVMATVGFEVLAPQRVDGPPVPLMSALAEWGPSLEALTRDACTNWVNGCLGPLRCALGAELDDVQLTYVNHFLDDDEGQSAFNVYLGSYLVMGEDAQVWSRHFLHSFYDWTLAQTRVTVPDRPFNLAKLAAFRLRDGSTRTDCTMNGAPWRAANRAVAGLRWPDAGEVQLIRNFVVLVRSDPYPAYSEELED
jgi:hypothetical protein